MAAHDRATLDFYEREAGTYLASRPDIVTEELAPFLARLQPGARILELGSGGGSDAAYMLALGFDVTPTDGVPAMAAAAGRRLGRPVTEMRFEELEAVDEYDAVIACASLLHVPREGLETVLHRIWRALRQGGWHLATYKTGADAGQDEFGRYYNQPERKWAETVYRAAGSWAELDFEEAMGVGYFSKPSRWLAVTARKA